MADLPQDVDDRVCVMESQFYVRTPNHVYFIRHHTLHMYRWASWLPFHRSFRNVIKCTHLCTLHVRVYAPRSYGAWFRVAIEMHCVASRTVVIWYGWLCQKCSYYTYQRKCMCTWLGGQWSCIYLLAFTIHMCTIARGPTLDCEWTHYLTSRNSNFRLPNHCSVLQCVYMHYMQ